ncbi:MAG TPA: DUF559 domain-containing protein [Acidimicrobiales bacterium]|nr:DUF559 domain-containing protein [Acidimicrobiales bacterium]
MKGAKERSIGRMRAQLGLITRAQALDAGLTTSQIHERLRNRSWTRVHAGVYAAAEAPLTPERDLLAATLAAGRAGPAVAASHLSAAWLLQLVDRPPRRPVITIPHGRAVRLEGAVVHRSRDLDLSRVNVRRGIPYTDPLRIMTDLAGELEPARLTPIVDRALATRLITTDGLEQEIARRARPGRRGPAALETVLRSRGLVGGPEPSVLEAEALRLFRRWGIPILGHEVEIFADGRYRIDFTVTARLAVEVDGFAHHWSPEAKAYDDRRRNRLRAAGITVLVYDWRSVKFEAARIAREIRTALRQAS